jgi:hypothetical protein
MGLHGARFAWRSTKAGRVLGTALLLTLAACALEPGLPPETGLAGVWSAEIVDGESDAFGREVEIVMGFAGGSGGAGWLRTVQDSSGVQLCSRFVFALDDGALSVVTPFRGAASYDVAEEGDEFVLAGEDVRLRLRRIAGSDPTDPPCATAATTLVATFDRYLHNASRLAGAGGSLYFNREASPSIIQRYDVATGALSEVAYTEPVNSQYRIVMAVRDDGAFYAHCFCAGTADALAVDVLANASFASFSSAALTAPFSVEYGERVAPGQIALGGFSNTSGTNRLAVLSDADLSLVAERDLLPGANVADIAVLDGTMYALVNGFGLPAVVRVGDDHRATASADVPALAGLFPRGLAAADGTLYVIGGDELLDRAYLFAVELP